MNPQLSANLFFDSKRIEFKSAAIIQFDKGRNNIKCKQRERINDGGTKT